MKNMKDYWIELQQSWNNIRNYYAGDNYIDWIGISIYGADQPYTEWKSFSQILDTVYQELAEFLRQNLWLYLSLEHWKTHNKEIKLNG